MLVCLILGLSEYVIGQPNRVIGKTTTAINAKGAISTSIARDTKLDGFTLIRDYDFGTAEGNTVHDSTELTGIFNSYGIAGTTVINSEWQRYLPINSKNHAISTNDLELTALPNLGGVQSGGISSGEITTKETFLPSVGKTYAFQIRAKIPKAIGGWPAFWMYAKDGAGATASEIDVFEFFYSANQNTYDWTGYDHGDGVGADYLNIKNNQWVWHPGFDFAADYHTYTLIWKKGDIQKWVDSTMVKGTYFEWIGTSAPQILLNLAMGGSINSNPIAADFPVKFKIDYLKIYIKDESTSGVDNQAPSIPSTLKSTYITQKSCILSWQASTDNAGVTGYEVFIDGKSIGITASTFFSVKGLSCGVTYSLTVRAKDAAGNWSDQSSSIDTHTIGCNITNIALNKSTTVSSTEAVLYKASFVNDGDATTRWSSLYADPQWVRIDLGATCTINGVSLIWEAAFGKAYQIQVSDDDATWSDIYSTTSSDGGSDDISGLTASGRYIRMYGTARNTPYGYSLFEFAVYGSNPTSGITSAIAPVNFRVFPNPASNKINIRMNKTVNNNVEIGIYNMQGQKVRSISRNAVKSDIITVDLNNLSKGMYTVKLIDKGVQSIATFSKE